MHFFNPVPVMALVEIVRGRETSDETVSAVTGSQLGSGKYREANDFPGFVSNRILMPYINEAAQALEQGVAEPEAIDTIAKLGFNHPMGPLALADLIGLDTCVAILEVLRDGLKDERYICPRDPPRARRRRPPGARAGAASTNTADLSLERGSGENLKLGPPATDSLRRLQEMAASDRLTR